MTKLERLRKLQTELIWYYGENPRSEVFALIKDIEVVISKVPVII